MQSLLTEGIDAMQSLARAAIKEVQAAEKDGFAAHTATAERRLLPGSRSSCRTWSRRRWSPTWSAAPSPTRRSRATSWSAASGSSTPATPTPTFAGAFGDPAEQVANITNFTTPELTRLIDQLKTTADFEERYALVEKFGLILNDEVPVVFVVGTPSMVGVRDAVKNVGGWTTPEGALGIGQAFGIARWGEVWLEK